MPCDETHSPAPASHARNPWGRCLALSFAGMLFCADALATTQTVASLLLPRVAGMSLADLQQRHGAMECQAEPAETMDCFMVLPFDADSRTAGNNEAKVFLRARAGHVGQIIINGPLEQLTPVLSILSQHYRASNPGVLRASAAATPCTQSSQWQREGQSALVKVCRNPQGKGGAEFVLNILADWYALSR